MIEGDRELKTVFAGTNVMRRHRCVVGLRSGKASAAEDGLVVKHSR